MTASRPSQWTESSWNKDTVTNKQDGNHVRLRELRQIVIAGPVRSNCLTYQMFLRRGPLLSAVGTKIIGPLKF